MKKKSKSEPTPTDELIFTVRITFSDDVKPKDFKEIHRHVVDALYDQYNHGPGISPEDSDISTMYVEVMDQNGNFMELDPTTGKIT
jgi:hypothetical protein